MNMLLARQKIFIIILMGFSIKKLPAMNCASV
jgi:hypothetical protein